MTIFDSKSFQINSTSKSAFCDKFEVTAWSFHKSDDYKNESGISSKNRIKKKVTFADDNGKDLFQIVIIDNSRLPDIQFASIYERATNHITTQKSDNRKSINELEFDWVTSFIQPASVYSRFKSELSKQKVKLATAVIIKHQLPDKSFQHEMTGIIKLVNLCFEKRVFVRLSSDSKWSSFCDFEAKYKHSSCEFLPDSNATCDIDEFEFQIPLPQNLIKETTYLQFVLGMETSICGSYWDNNSGNNYRLDYCQVSVDNLHVISAPSPYTRDYKPNMEPFQSGYTGYRAWNHFSEEINFY